VTTPWETLLIRSAYRSVPFREADHLSLSGHVNPDVRSAWGARDDIPTPIAVRRALAEIDPDVLETFVENDHMPVEAISVIAEHHPNRDIALLAAMNARCPDDVAARVLNGRLRSRVKRSQTFESFELDGRPLVTAVLGAILPAEHLVEFATAATRCEEARKQAIAAITRRIHGCGERFAKQAVAALMVLDADCDRKSRNHAARNGGVLQAWVDLRDGTGEDCCRRLDLADHVYAIGNQHADLLLTRAGAEHAVEVIAQLAYNSRVDIGLLAAHLRTLPNAKEVIGTTSWRWTPSLVYVLGDVMLAALESDSSLMHTRVHDAETLAALAAGCRSNRVYRLIAAHPACTVELAITLPAGAALEAYHDPGLLLGWVTTQIGAAGDAASTLSMEFSGSLADLVGVAQRLIQG